MHPNTYKETAIRYYVDDQAGALIPGSRLSNILKELELKKHISENSKDFLQKKGLLALLSYSKKEISFSDFSKVAEMEQLERRHIAEACALKEQARKKLEEVALLAKRKIEEEALFAKRKIAQQQEEAKRRAFDNDPRNIAKAKQLKLRGKYGLSCFIEKADYKKLMDILRRVDNGERLSEDEVFWLSTKRKDFYTGYFTEELKVGFHKNEANFYKKEFENSKDPWLAVNASSHYRRCKQSRTAESILCTIDVYCLRSRKLKSAICTTHGGVKRDLKKFDEALNLGKKAHEFTPQDFRPCTLIGAVYMETGYYDFGRSWYKKAVDRGYSEESVDDELRVIFKRAEKSKQEAFRAHLLRDDPVRYSWANEKVNG